MTGYSGETLAKAQRLRREMTDAERKLWSALRNRQLDGVKFRRQQPIGPFIADFVCQERRLVLRFWNTDILTYLEGVAQAIAAALSSPHPAQAAPESPSPSRGEGFNGAHHA